MAEQLKAQPMSVAKQAVSEPCSRGAFTRILAEFSETTKTSSHPVTQAGAMGVVACFVSRIPKVIKIQNSNQGESARNLEFLRLLIDFPCCLSTRFK